VSRVNRPQPGQHRQRGHRNEVETATGEAPAAWTCDQPGIQRGAILASTITPFDGPKIMEVDLLPACCRERGKRLSCGVVEWMRAYGVSTSIQERNHWD
jgi:hypothetical protein